MVDLFSSIQPLESGSLEGRKDRAQSSWQTLGRSLKVHQVCMKRLDIAFIPIQPQTMCSGKCGDHISPTKHGMGTGNPLYKHVYKRVYSFCHVNDERLYTHCLKHVI